MWTADVAVCIENEANDAARICAQDEQQREGLDLVKHHQMWSNMFLLLFLLS